MGEGTPNWRATWSSGRAGSPGASSASGPIDPALSGVAEDLALVSVLSGNRNFEGRINPDVRMNYLTSPPLVVAYALAGTMDIDLTWQDQLSMVDIEMNDGVLEGEGMATFAAFSDGLLIVGGRGRHAA